MSKTNHSTVMIAGLGGFLLAALALAPSNAAAATAEPNASALRVCADPDYLPFSNRSGQGFENKVAEVLAHSMGRPIEYHWASTRVRGGFSNFLADTLDAGKCDLVMDLPYGDNEEGYTQPYYTSSYVFIQRKDNNGLITSMSSPDLHGMKIGYEEDTTPEMALKMFNLTGNVMTFNVAERPGESPEQFLQAVQSGKIDVAITWEPAVGYYLKNYPDLKVHAVPSEQYGPGLPQVGYTYQMAIGVRPKDEALKEALDKALDADKQQIASVLTDYNVKLYKSAEQFTTQ